MKQKATNKGLSLLLTLVMVLTLIPMSVSADGSELPQITVKTFMGIVPSDAASDTAATTLATSINTWASTRGISASASGSTVTVTGADSTATTMLTITIPTGVIVDWQATLIITTSGENHGIKIANGSGGTFKVSAGSITHSGDSGCAAINNDSTATVEVTGGTVESTSTGSNSFAIYNESTGAVNVSGGTVTAVQEAISNYGGTVTVSSNGTVSSTGYYAINNAVAASIVNITGGTVTSAGSGGRAIMNSGIVNVSDGIVKTTGGGSSHAIMNNTATSVINVTGGTVIATGSNGRAIYANTSTTADKVNVSGGQVISTTTGAFNNTSVTVNGNAVVFSKTSPAPSYNPTGNAVVITWTGSAASYAETTNTDLTVAPAGASAVWWAESSNTGIKYISGSNTGWIALSTFGVTLTLTPAPVATAVAWNGLTANGTSGSETTTQLTLTFDVDPASLTADDITVTGATKGTLSGTGTSRTLAISDITVADGANVTVALTDPAGFTITPLSKTIAVYIASGGGATGNYTLYYNNADGKMYKTRTGTGTFTYTNEVSNTDVPGWSAAQVGGTGAYVLTLNGINFTTTAQYGLVTDADATIELAEGSTNTIANVATSGTSYGISSGRPTTIQGTGTLIASGGDTSGWSVGIMSGGNLTIADGTVIASGNGSGYSYGIYDTMKETQITGGTVTASGKTSAFDQAPKSLPTSYTADFSTNADGTGGTTGATSYTWNASHKYVKIVTAPTEPTVTASTFTAITYGDAQPAVQNITIENKGSAAVTINSVALSGTNASSFTIGGSGASVPASGNITTWTVRPNANLAVGTHTATITVTYDTDKTVTATVSIVVSKAAYTGTTTASATVKADEATTGATLTLPTLPDGASYATVTSIGALISGTSTVSGTTLTYSTTSQSANTSATITIAVTSATNYNDYSVAVTITAQAKTAQTIAFPNSNAGITKTYGDAAFTHEATGGTGTGATTYASDDTTIATVDSTGSVTILKVGTATITATKAADTTYAEATASYTITVNKAIITITADNKTVTAGAAVPTYTYKVTGLVGSDTLASPTSLTCTYTAASPAGSYPITPSGAAVPTGGNYEDNIIYVNGTLTVADKQYTITFNANGGSVQGNRMKK